LVIGGFAIGGSVFAAIEFIWVNPDNVPENKDTKLWNDPGLLDRVPSLFILEGVITAAMNIIGCLLLSEAPANDQLPMLRDNEQRQSTASINGSPSTESQRLISGQDEGSDRIIKVKQPKKTLSYSPWKMMQTSNFWCIAATFFCVGCCTSYLVGASKEVGIFLLFDDRQMVIVIFVANLVNGLTRPFWGWAHDRFDTKACCFVLCVSLGVSFCLWHFMAAFWVFNIWVSILYAFASAPFAIFPAATLSYFGPQYFGVNYGFVFACYAITSLFVALVNTTHFWQGLLSLQARLIILGAVCIFGVVPSFFFPSAGAGTSDPSDDMAAYSLRSDCKNSSRRSTVLSITKTKSESLVFVDGNDHVVDRGSQEVVQEEEEEVHENVGLLTLPLVVPIVKQTSSLTTEETLEYRFEDTDN